MSRINPNLKLEILGQLNLICSNVGVVQSELFLYHPALYIRKKYYLLIFF